jgi:hypothetical protein
MALAAIQGSVDRCTDTRLQQAWPAKRRPPAGQLCCGSAARAPKCKPQAHASNTTTVCRYTILAATTQRQSANATCKHIASISGSTSSAGAIKHNTGEHVCTCKNCWDAGEPASSRLQAAEAPLQPASQALITTSSRADHLIVRALNLDRAMQKPWQTSHTQSNHSLANPKPAA